MNLSRRYSPRSVSWLRIACFAILSCSLASAEVRTLWQTLHDYNTIIAPDKPGRQDRSKVNPFLSYTNIGTDFGFVGPAERAIGWQSGQIGVTLDTGVDSWAGMWHSLARLERMRTAVMDFHACYPSPILPAYQPKITGLRVVIRGKGRFKIDLTNVDNQVLFTQSRDINHKEFVEEIYDLPLEKLSAVKTFTWIAEAGSDIDIDRIDLRVVTPDVSFDQWLFVASYAKALTCWSADTGLVRDRAHIEDGAFDSVSSTGFFCLATAAAASEGIVEKKFAREVMRKALAAVKNLRGPHGLLPHFIRYNQDGVLERHPGTEYSTIDTALFDLSLIISAKILGEDDLLRELVAAAGQVKFAALINADGFVSHGVMSDGKTIIPYHWRDWGGETALVLVMLRLGDSNASARMSNTARPHQGTGFIAEIQSLLLPDFDLDTSDKVSGANWKEVRKALLRDQKKHAATKLADTEVGKAGIFGLSAGEQRHGMGYAVGGVDLEEQMLLHPHYVLMSAALDDEPQQVRDTLKVMERKRIFTPWGMVENVAVIDGETLPMLGSLNACFEALGAYHFLKKTTSTPNAIYQASREIPELTSALKIFYP
jgi:hypothetical protein